jgi:hypothetical protein
MITIAVTPSEVHRLVLSLEAEAMAAIDDGKDDYAYFLLRPCAELREMVR